MKLKFFLPLIVFIGLAFLFYATMDRDTRLVPSPLVGKPAPSFELPSLDNANNIISPASLLGKPWILNVWASWCRECRIEHPLFNELAATSDVTIVGLNYKDKSAEAKQWLNQLGNPYNHIAFDTEGSAGLDWGVYGVPETFVIDAKGIIRYKHIGPISAKDLEQDVLPLLTQN